MDRIEIGFSVFIGIVTSLMLVLLIIDVAFFKNIVLTNVDTIEIIDVEGEGDFYNLIYLDEKGVECEQLMHVEDVEVDSFVDLPIACDYITITRYKEGLVFGPSDYEYEYVLIESN